MILNYLLTICDNIPSWKHVHHYQVIFYLKYSEPTHKLYDTSVEIIVLLYSKQTKTLYFVVESKYIVIQE